MPEVGWCAWLLVLGRWLVVLRVAAAGGCRVVAGGSWSLGTPGNWWLVVVGGRLCEVVVVSDGAGYR